MKRQKEIKNLIENVNQNICDNCRRWNGEFKEKYYKNNKYLTDMYSCKYNVDNKGLHIGFCIEHPQNYKCKYFKRSFKYVTCRFKHKHYTSYSSGEKIKEIKWIKGKFKNIKQIKEKKNNADRNI